MPENNQSLPPAAVVVRSRVADFDRWIAAFDTHEDVRRAAGILGDHINRAEADPNDVSIYMAVSDLDKAKAFSASDDLRERMQAAGVISAPQFTYMTPVREAIVWDRELPAFMLSHKVADFDRWLKGYDAAAGLRPRMGSWVRPRTCRWTTDGQDRLPPSRIVRHAARVLANDELQAKMQVGVISAPDVQFVTGGWAKQYH